MFRDSWVFADRRLMRVAADRQVREIVLLADDVANCNGHVEIGGTRYQTRPWVGPSGAAYQIVRLPAAVLARYVGTRGEIQRRVPTVLA